MAYSGHFLGERMLGITSYTGVHRRVFAFERLGFAVKVARVYRWRYALRACRAWLNNKEEWHFIDSKDGRAYACKTAQSLEWLFESFLENWRECRFYREGTDATWRPLVKGVYCSCAMVGVYRLGSPRAKAQRGQLQRFMFTLLGPDVYMRDNHHLGNPANYDQAPGGRIVFLDYGGPSTQRLIRTHYEVLKQARPFA